VSAPTLAELRSREEQQHWLSARHGGPLWPATVRTRGRPSLLLSVITRRRLKKEEKRESVRVCVWWWGVGGAVGDSAF
jgi:hypothetical protein